MSFNIPTSQVAAQMNASSNPVSTVTINQTAEVPKFPSSGVHTFIRVLYASIDPIDYKLPGLPWPLPRLAIGVNPISPSQPFVGRVWKTTDSRFKSGDLVWGKLAAPTRFGTTAGYVLVSGEEGIVKVPEGYNRGLEEFAAAGVVALTAYQTLKAGDLPFNNGGQGGSVFINGGSGGVGTFTVQLAKHVYRADKVVVSCSGSNVELVKSLGADTVIDYRSTNLVDALKEWAQKNGPFDQIIDNVGSDSHVYWQAHHYLKAGGNYVQVGAGMDVGSIVTMAKQMLLPTALGGGKRAFQFVSVAVKKNDLENLGQWLAEGKIKAVIEDSNRFDLADTKKAYEQLHTGRTRGKIVIRVGADDQ